MSGKVRTFKRYPKYKDSGVEWLGKIPSGWQISRLKRLARFVGGGTPAKEHLAFWGGDISWVSPKDMKVAVVNDTEDKITPDAVRESATSLVPKDSVLIVVRSGILIHTIPVALAGRELTLNQDLKAIIPNRELVPSYLRYFVLGMQQQLLNAWKKEGATVESLEMDLIVNTTLPLPDIVQQHAIAAFLDRETARIDALVAKKERLIELLQEKRSALITRAVTKGLDPNVPMKDSGVELIGRIPKIWNVGALARWWPVVDCKHRTVPFVDDGVAVASIGEVHELTLDLSGANRTTDIEYKQMIDGGRAPSIGDIIYSRNATVGETSLVTTQEPFCMGQDVSLIRSRGDGWFLVFLLRSPVVMEQLESEMVGSTFKRINVGRIKRLLVTCPPRDQRQAIGEFCLREYQKVEHLIEKVRSATTQLGELRTALISAAVTGKIDVREEVA